MSRPDWDPGWNAQLIGMFVPSRRADLARSPALATIRFLWLSFVFALLSFVAVLAVIAPAGETDAGWFPWAILATAVAVHLVGVPVVHRRMVADGTPDSLVASFREAMFLGIFISEAIAMLGFVGAIARGGLWVYLLAMPLALLGLVRVGPLQRVFERCDERLRERGSPLRMTEA